VFPGVRPETVVTPQTTPTAACDSREGSSRMSYTLSRPSSRQPGLGPGAARGEQQQLQSLCVLGGQSMFGGVGL
jgi:hypothetical protein